MQINSFQSTDTPVADLEPFKTPEYYDITNIEKGQIEKSEVKNKKYKKQFDYRYQGQYYQDFSSYVLGMKESDQMNETYFDIDNQNTLIDEFQQIIWVEDSQEQPQDWRYYHNDE